MRIAFVIARYLAGVIFLVMGLNGFLHFIPLPPPEGIAGQFMGALYVSHYLWVIFAFRSSEVYFCSQPLRTAGGGATGAGTGQHSYLPRVDGPCRASDGPVVAILWTAIFIQVRPAFSGLFQSRWQPRA